MKQGRPKKIDNIDLIKEARFEQFNDIIQTYIRLMKEALRDDEISPEIKLKYNAILSLPRYLINILILKAEYNDTKIVAKILNMEDQPELVSSAITQGKNKIKQYVKHYNSPNIDLDYNSNNS